MNEYGWGKMMDDYVFLEDMSRKVGDLGREIVRGGYSFGKGAGRGRTKRDVLKLQLEARDIDVDLLPLGMERRKVNQSCWDFKYVFAFKGLINFTDSRDDKKSNSFINHRIQILQTPRTFFTTAFYPINTQKQYQIIIARPPSLTYKKPF